MSPFDLPVYHACIHYLEQKHGTPRDAPCHQDGVLIKELCNLRKIDLNYQKEVIDRRPTYLEANLAVRVWKRKHSTRLQKHGGSPQLGAPSMNCMRGPPTPG